VNVGVRVPSSDMAPPVGQLILINPLAPVVTEPGKAWKGEHSKITPADWAEIGGIVVVEGVLAEDAIGRANENVMLNRRITASFFLIFSPLLAWS